MLTREEFDVLTLLAEVTTPLSQIEIAEKMHVSLGAINKTIKELGARHLCDKGTITLEGVNALEPYRVKRAVFIAAGFGSRMAPITFNTPKPLVRVHGTRIIDTLLDAVVAAGIPEIVIVRGYLGEQFDQLRYKYPQIKFVENPVYNEANNISSAVCARYFLQNAYVLEADLVLRDKSLIRKYEFESNFLGIPVEHTEDWCLITDSDDIVIEEKIGGQNCHQMVGISYWNAADGAKLANDLDEVYRLPDGKKRYWEQVPLTYKRENYQVRVRECFHKDIREIDSFAELKEIDSLYAM